MRAISRALPSALLCAALACSGFAGAADFRSSGPGATVMYDAPSRASVALYVLSPGYPLEVIVDLEAWVKVRDHTGALSWVEKRSLTDRRMVMVIAPAAEVRQRPEESAPVVFRAMQFVALELMEVRGNGWIRIRHADGANGFLRANELWGL